MKNKNIIKNITVAAPASPFDKNTFKENQSLLDSLGVITKYTDNIFLRTGYTVGTPKHRSDYLAKAINSKTDAIFFARGGYGSAQLLPMLDSKNISKGIKDKIIMGYSDVTALFCFLYSKYNKKCLYGPNITSQYFKNIPLLKKILKKDYALKEKIKVLKGQKNKITGPVFGGCLSVMASLAGTPYLKKLDGHILFIEDTNEAPYKIDRMLTQLLQAKIINKIKAISVGAMEKCESPGISWKEPVLRIANELNIPVVYGIRAGHAEFKTVVNLGAKATIDFNKKEFEIKD